MSAFRDLTNQRFGRLTVLRPVRKNKEKHIYWVCQCDCGNQTTVRSSSLDPKRTQSCGCLQKERMSQAKAKHGMTGTKIYNSWCAMNWRCYNPNHSRFSDYGGRGISVCEEWRNSFKTYFDYVSSLPNYGDPNRTPDRIDNDGNYEPGNIRWATRSEQQMNKRKKKQCVQT
jgi:hypothetical protein